MVAVDEAAPGKADARRRGGIVGGAGQCDRLEPALARRGDQSERGKAHRDEAGGDLVPAGAGLAPFKQVVAEEADVGAEAVGGEIRLGGSGDGRSGEEHRGEDREMRHEGVLSGPASGRADRPAWQVLARQPLALT